MATTRVEKKTQETRIEAIRWGELKWLNIEGATEREMEYLSKHYPFDPLDLEDTMSRIERPKIDEYDDYLFIVLHFPVFPKEGLIARPVQLSVFIGKEYVITVHPGLKPVSKLFRQCQIDKNVLQDTFSEGSAFLLYHIIDRMVDSYFPVLDRLLTEIADLEDNVFDENVEASQDIARLRRAIITQRRTIWPMRTVISSLEGKLQQFAKKELSVYFGDIVDHLNRSCESLDEYKEIIEIFKDTDFVLSNYRINRIVRTLTMISATILPFVVVSSIYGMNIPLPGGLEQGSLRSFLTLLLIMFSITGGMLFFFRRKHWV